MWQDIIKSLFGFIFTTLSAIITYKVKLYIEAKQKLKEKEAELKQKEIELKDKQIQLVEKHIKNI